MFGSYPVLNLRLNIYIHMKIAFYKGNGPLNKLISFFCRGGYSHVAIIQNDGIIIEAYPFKGVRIRKDISDKMKRCRVDVFEVQTTSEQDAIIKNFLVAQIGKKYDWWAIFGFVFHTTREGRKQYGKWICSELVFAAFRKASISLLERIEAWMVSPTILSYNTTMSYKETHRI